MKAIAVAATAALALTAASLATATPADERWIKRRTTAPPFVPREVTDNAASFGGQNADYVIIGGGNAGLVIAERLSEDSNVTVAVIEAGTSGYETNKLDSPGGTYYNSPGGPNSPYDWQYPTVPQQHMDGNPRTWPRGRVLGGSTAINGMYIIRASQPELDSWAQLNDAQPVWGWDNFLTGMKKSETFTGPDQSLPFEIPYNADSRGTDGHLHVSYPGTSYPVVNGFINAMSSLGSPLNRDPYNGDNTGSYVGTAAINPTNWTRSFARSAYLDPFAYRDNLRVLTGAHVTKINFQDDQDQPDYKRAVSVTFQSSPESQGHTITANREVILTAGAVGSPQVLQLSGVGQKDFIQSKGIEPVIDLPGVGHGVSDHLVTSVSFAPRQGASLPPSRVTGDAKVDSYINTATSYVNLTTLLGGQQQASEFISSLRSNLTSIIDSYDSAPESVKRGYNATLSESLRLLEQGTSPMEMLFASVFGGVQIQLALQHSLSRGTVMIKNANAFEYPSIDPRYGQQQADIVLLRAAMKLARRAGATDAFQEYAAAEVGDTTNAQDDAAIDAHIRRAAQTEYHPAGSCSMLPFDQGGVVDQTLLVYNTTNLRVVDGSVPPAPLSTHLMTVVYGMAEIGADIIKAAARGEDYKGMKPDRAVASQSSDDSGNGNGSSKKNNSDSSNSDSGGSTSSAGSTRQSGALAMAASVLFATAFSLLS
ncbi:unnamed protein product [Sympodiomycopsis kandeliae]